MIKKLGLLWGFLFLLGGILGFVPGITKGDMFLGFFMVNTPHNILHIISGLIFLVASLAGPRATRLWFIIFGIFYAGLSALGFAAGDHMIFNLISNTKIDSWGHGFLALVLFLIGVVNPRQFCCGNENCGKTLEESPATR